METIKVNFFNNAYVKDLYYMIINPALSDEKIKGIEKKIRELLYKIYAGIRQEFRLFFRKVNRS